MNVAVAALIFTVYPFSGFLPFYTLQQTRQVGAVQEWNLYPGDSPRDQGKCPLNRSGAFIKHKAVLPAIFVHPKLPSPEKGGGRGGCLLEEGSLFEKGVNNGGLVSTALQCSVVQSTLSNADTEGTERSVRVRSVRKIYARK